MKKKALLRKLTLEGKVGQMTQVTSHIYLKDDSSDQHYKQSALGFAV